MIAACSAILAFRLLFSFDNLADFFSSLSREVFVVRNLLIWAETDALSF